MFSLKMNYNNLTPFLKISHQLIKNPAYFTRNVRYFHAVFLRFLSAKSCRESRVDPRKVLGSLRINKDVIMPAGIIRLKSRDAKRKKQSPRASVDLESETSDDEEEGKWVEHDEDGDEPGKDYKDIVASIGSMRLDNVLKAGLGISKNKIEVAFYDSKLRLNGIKVLKKSLSVKLGDEADVIIGKNSKNDEFLDVSRVVIRGVIETERTKVKLRRYKRLTIQNYPERWKEIESKDL